MALSIGQTEAGESIAKSLAAVVVEQRMSANGCWPDGHQKR
ncbi:hypothetical protein [Rheinheimera sp.]|nr:hypothetical protein [Rheinheimera sp.]